MVLVTRHRNNAKIAIALRTNPWVFPAHRNLSRTFMSPE